MSSRAQAELRGDEPDGSRAVDVQLAVPALDEPPGHCIEFVVDLADQLFEDVFEREEPDDRAVFVDHEREVPALRWH